jgi:hypothetical protein
LTAYNKERKANETFIRRRCDLVRTRYGPRQRGLLRALPFGWLWQHHLPRELLLMLALWHWLDFPGWWRTVSKPADFKVLMWVTWIWALTMLIGALGIYATRQMPEPF